MQEKYKTVIKKSSDEFLSHLGLAFLIALIAQVCFHVDQTYCVDILFVIVGLMQLRSLILSVQEIAKEEIPNKGN